MPYYLQRQCKNEPKALTIASGQNVRFDNLYACSKRKETEEGAEIEDFEYEAERGLIEIKRVGTYVILWTVRQQTGLPADGRTFQLVQEDPDPLTTPDPSAEDPDPIQLKTTWIEKAGASTQLKITNSIGTGMIVKENERDIIKIALQNISKDAVTLSPSSPIPAQILIFGIGDFDGDMEAISARLDYLESTWKDLDLIQFPEILTRLGVIEDNQDEQKVWIEGLEESLSETYDELVTLITPSDIYHQEYVAPDIGISGVITYCRRAENTYIFWTEGSYTDGTFPAGDRVYLWRANSEYDPTDSKNPWRALSWYQGAPTIAPVWLHVGSSAQIIPLQADNSGLYFYKADIQEKLVEDSHFSFIFGLMLSKEGE